MNKRLLIFIFLFSSWVLQANAEFENTPEDKPLVSVAKKESNDPWYSYNKRPLIESQEAKEIYGPDLLAKIAAKARTPVTHVPWTIMPPDPQAPLFKLKDVVVDRIKDPITKKNYVKLYHATTSDLLDIFKPGAQAIKFNVAALTGLGMGFYLAANVNEAKFYGCERLGTRKAYNPDLKTLLLVIGVLEDDIIQGKWAQPDTKHSDDQTGESYDKAVYFARNEERHNQFVFFKNVSPYLKIFEIITLPDGFGKALERQDGDGLPLTSDKPDTHYGFKCAY